MSIHRIWAEFTVLDGSSYHVTGKTVAYMENGEHFAVHLRYELDEPQRVACETAVDAMRMAARMAGWSAI